MNLFLGSRDEIGVEVIVTECNNDGAFRGYARLWMGGQFLGDILDYIYLGGYLLGGLYEILRVKEMTYLTFPVDKTEQYLYLINKANDMNDEESDSYLIGFGTMTDAFSIWAYKKDDFIEIIWKLVHTEGNYLSDALQGYPNEVFKYKVKYSVFEDFVKRLERIFKNW